MSTVGNWRGPNIVSNGLVFYLDPGSPNSFVNKNSTRIVDISGAGITGSLTNGPLYSTAGSGSILLDGSNDYISFGDIASLNFTTPFSIGCWFNAATTQPSVDSGLIGNINASYTGYMLWYNNNTVDFYFNSGIKANSSTTITQGIWYNVMGVWTGTTAILYLNGVQNATGAVSIPPSSVGRFFSIGFYQSGRNFAGNIGICTAYNTALTAAEVLQNHNQTKTRYGL